MDFQISEEIEQYRKRIAAFVDAHILPLESDPSAYDGHGNIALARLEPLRAKARAEGLWCLQLKPETGGKGLGKIGMAVCYEAMNRSIFGPVVFNSSAHRRGQSPLGVCDDRAPSRRRVRSRHDPDPCREAGIGLRYYRPQMVHHGSRGSEPFYPDGAYLG